MFEKVVYEQLMKYQEEHKIICQFQPGFGASHSVETLLLQATNEWLRNLNVALINDVLFVDLKKAFDTINHTMLLPNWNVTLPEITTSMVLVILTTGNKYACKIIANNSLPTFQKVQTLGHYYF